MKYIIYDGCYPILFPSHLDHAEIHIGVSKHFEKVTSAGFCKLDDDGKLYCAGYSKSLSNHLNKTISAKATDIQVISSHFSE